MFMPLYMFIWLAGNTGSGLIYKCNWDCQRNSRMITKIRLMGSVLAANSRSKHTDINEVVPVVYKQIKNNLLIIHYQVDWDWVVHKTKMRI